MKEKGISIDPNNTDVDTIEFIFRNNEEFIKFNRFFRNEIVSIEYLDMSTPSLENQIWTIVTLDLRIYWNRKYKNE